MQFNYLYSFFIRPIELILEFIFSSVYKLTGNIGVSIIFVGLIMNILILPIYMRADKITKDNSLKKIRIKKWISKINAAFKGDERFMILQALYRENHYSPLSILLDSLPILFEVPFFIAGFHLLSNLKIVQGVSFLFIKDLGLPDNLFTIGSFAVNVLPILMTLINLVSCSVYSKEQSVSTRVQGYVLAALFLILLYDSPSGLVLYWTTNNLFSLVKNIIVEMILPKCNFHFKNVRRIRLFDYKHSSIDTFFALLGLFLVSFLTGVLVSSDVISSNSQAFMDQFHPINPNSYVFNSFFIAAGLYIFWGGVIYFMVTDYYKNILLMIIYIFSSICVINYFGFGPGGTLTDQLVLFGDINEGHKGFLNSIVILLLVVLFIILYKNNKSYPAILLILQTTAVLTLGIINIVKIENDYKESSYIFRQNNIESIHLSGQGKNVIVIMLDKGMGGIIPYVLNEDPTIEDQFDGFTFYPNTLSYGIQTMIGVPSLYGGYEYTPENLNLRTDELLRDKHDESMLVMPVNFLENGFNVTLCDPTLGGYRWISDYSVFDAYPDINVYNMMGVFNNYIDGIRNFNLYERNFFCYGFFRLSPVFMRGLFYDNSMFNAADREYFFDYIQIDSSPSTSRGYSTSFLDSYTELTSLPQITNIDDSSENSFLMFTNNCVHNPSMLSEPDYEPALVIDNTAYDSAHTERFIIEDNTIALNTNLQMSYYQSMICTLHKLGDWFDYLRAAGCYDNTRIIIVADHGLTLYDTSTPNEYSYISQAFNPLLMVKDFDATGFTVSDEIMTNAETCFLAFDGLIDNPINPSTGNYLTSELSAGHFRVLYNDHNIIDDNYDLYCFTPGEWYEVDGNINNPDNWSYLGTW